MVQLSLATITLLSASASLYTGVHARKRTTTLLQKRDSAPDGFTHCGAPSDDHTIDIHLALAANDITGLQRKLETISDPASPSFRQWLSKEEVKSHSNPSDTTKKAVWTWAQANNLNMSLLTSEALPNEGHGQWLSLSIPVAHANRLFDAQFTNYTHDESGHSLVRTLSFSLPDELVEHVTTAYPTTSFALPRAAREVLEVRWPSRRRNVLPRQDPSASAVNASCVDAMTPPCLEKLYGIPTTMATQSNNSIMITGYEGQYLLQEGLSSFIQKYQPLLDPSTTTFDWQNISNPQLRRGGEANLDVEYVMGLALGVKTTYLGVGGNDVFKPWLDTIEYVKGLENPPSVLSTSYSVSETDVDFATAKQLCDGYMALGARGISVIFSSGDGGVTGDQSWNDDCGDNKFVPTFPSTCPYVTSVGATEGISPERAANLSSGGFSNYFPQPSYQSTSVSSFLSSLPSDFPGQFNKSGRAFPDVSAQGVNFPIMITSDYGYLEAGTSASAPTIAAIIAVLNDRLLEKGKPVMGFLNPWIYANQNAFTDVKEGKNPGTMCSESEQVSFSAGEGWDPLTGVGTPLYEKMAVAVGL